MTTTTTADEKFRLFLAQLVNERKKAVDLHRHKMDRLVRVNPGDAHSFGGVVNRMMEHEVSNARLTTLDDVITWLRDAGIDVKL